MFAAKVTFLKKLDRAAKFLLRMSGFTTELKTCKKPTPGKRSLQN